MESEWRKLGDELGPAKVVLIRQPEVDLEAPFASILEVINQHLIKIAAED